MANLDTNVRATSGLMKGSVALVVWELQPVKIEKNGDFLYFFFILHMIGQTYGIFSPLRRWPILRKILGLPLGKNLAL